MGVSQQQFQVASASADLAGKATVSIEQAGRGLGEVYLQCKANTADIDTIQRLLAVQGHVNDAIRALLEREVVQTLPKIVS